MKISTERCVQVTVSFYSYFQELTGCQQMTLTVPEQMTIGAAIELLLNKFPRLQGMRKSMLVAVGVEFQDHEYALKDGDEVAFFPPVQGG